jgi:hypothetical protein
MFWPSFSAHEREIIMCSPDLPMEVLVKIFSNGPIRHLYILGDHYVDRDGSAPPSPKWIAQLQAHFSSTPERLGLVHFGNTETKIFGNLLVGEVFYFVCGHYKTTPWVPESSGYYIVSAIQYRIGPDICTMQNENWKTFEKHDLPKYLAEFMLGDCMETRMSPWCSCRNS